MSIEEQLASIRSHQQYKRDQFLSEMNKVSRFDHKNSQVRAQILVWEAKRLEEKHIQHQIEHCKAQLSKQHAVFKASNPNSHNQRNSIVNGKQNHHQECAPCAAPKCACLSLHHSRVLTPMWRARNILSRFYRPELLEQTVQSLFAQSTSVLNDVAIADSLLVKYNIEEPAPTMELWLACAQERMAGLDAKWKNISWNVNRDMRDRDMFPHVIRNLSVMRIFLEGSQNADYTSDNFERMRRETTSLQLLGNLRSQGKLFIDQQH